MDGIGWAFVVLAIGAGVPFGWWCWLFHSDKLKDAFNEGFRKGHDEAVAEALVTYTEPEAAAETAPEPGPTVPIGLSSGESATTVTVSGGAPESKTLARKRAARSATTAVLARKTVRKRASKPNGRHD